MLFLNVYQTARKELRHRHPDTFRVIFDNLLEENTRDSYNTLYHRADSRLTRLYDREYQEILNKVKTSIMRKLDAYDK